VDVAIKTTSTKQFNRFYGSTPKNIDNC